MKGTSFLIQALNSYFFLSADGNLYFSEVQQNDEGNYHCIVTLTAFPGDTLATDQPPSETSLEIKLDVLGDSALVIRLFFFVAWVTLRYIYEHIPQRNPFVSDR